MIYNIYHMFFKHNDIFLLSETKEFSQQFPKQNLEEGKIYCLEFNKFNKTTNKPFYLLNFQISDFLIDFNKDGYEYDCVNWGTYNNLNERYSKNDISVPLKLILIKMVMNMIV